MSIELGVYGHNLPSPNATVQALAERYPLTMAAFAAMGALDHLDRIARLDAVWDEIRWPPADDRRPPDSHRALYGGPSVAAKPSADEIYTQSKIQNAQRAPESKIDFDLIYAGGGLGLIHAAVMARRYGYRVLLFDRGEVGCAQREWNIS